MWANFFKIMIAEVIVDVSNSNVDKVFDYLVPENSGVELGDRVLLPFGNRTIEGYVIGFKEISDYDNSKLKTIIKKLDDYPIIKLELLKLALHSRSLYHLRLNDSIKLIVPSQIRNGKVKAKIEKQVYLCDDENKILTYIQSLRKNSRNPILTINYLKEKGKENISVLNKLFSNSCVSKLISDEIIKVEEVRLNRNENKFNVKDKVVTLTQNQQKAVDKVLSSKAKTFVLHGVTGSGKTEVYMHIIEEVLKNNKTAIMLVPEISLTPQVVGIFNARFGSILAVLHSGLSNGEKYDEWCRLYSGEAKIAIGARSAIFAPLENVGVIIIDEEHDNSYLSESNPRYLTHDLAIFRSQFNDCPLVLGSATPSLDTYFKAKSDEYKLIELPTRVNGKDMPTVTIVDMCKEFRGGNTTPFSADLLGELNNTIKEGNQAILFINRRGYSSFIMCRECSYIPKCTDCDVSLVLHKDENELKCHYCGKRFRNLTNCPECGSESIKMGGVGTQRVVSDLKEIFPNVPIFRMDNDNTQTKDAHHKILSEFGKTKPAILVGTQMIAKGHDFPEVNLVGILDADLSLFFNDYKATEKTFQLITQVAGRAGRSEIEGKVILQTYFPRHYVYKLSANYNFKAFYEKEINLRETTNFPPFSKIIRVLITSENDDLAKDVIHKSFMRLKSLRLEYGKDFYFLEVMKSPVTKIKNKFRYQIVARFNKTIEEEVVNRIFDIVEEENKNKCTCFIETNPQNLS